MQIQGSKQDSGTGKGDVFPAQFLYFEPSLGSCFGYQGCVTVVDLLEQSLQKLLSYLKALCRGFFLPNFGVFPIGENPNLGLAGSGQVDMRADPWYLFCYLLLPGGCRQPLLCGQSPVGQRVRRGECVKDLCERRVRMAQMELQSPVQW